MERYGRPGEGSQSDPSPEWTGAGGETGLEGGFICLCILNWAPSIMINLVFAILISGLSRMWSVMNWV